MLGNIPTAPGQGTGKHGAHLGKREEGKMTGRAILHLVNKSSYFKFYILYC